MRTITLIVIHCSAVRPDQQSSAADIDRWHWGRGWAGIGYHYVVRRDGQVECGRSIERIGAHCKGHNNHSIGICYEGGLDESGKAADTRTPEQKMALKTLIKQLLKQFPMALVVGHHDLDPMKMCPCYDVVGEMAKLRAKCKPS